MNLVGIPWSLQRQFTLLCAGCVAATSLILGWVGFHASAQVLKNETVRSVGIAADSRKRELVNILEELQQRSDNFLTATIRVCATMAGAEFRDCWASSLDVFVATEEASAAWLESPNFSLIQSSGVDTKIPKLVKLKQEQFAWFVREESGRSFFLIEQSTLDGLFKIILQYDTEKKTGSIFENRYGLGNSGEAFLTDSNGLFLTKGRYNPSSGHSHSIKAGPMITCLGGQDGEALEPDYREVPVIHGYRFVPEGGGACIMAHMDQAEAFAPVSILRWKIGVLSIFMTTVAVAFSLLWSSRVSKSLAALTNYAECLISDNFSANPPSNGPGEVRKFAFAFNKIVHTIRERNNHILARHYQLRVLIDMVPSAIVGLDSQGRMTEWNSGATQAFGWTRDEAIGQCLDSFLLSAEDRLNFKHCLHRLAESSPRQTAKETIQARAVHRTSRILPADFIFVKIPGLGDETDETLHYVFVIQPAVTDVRSSHEPQNQTREGHEVSTVSTSLLKGRLVLVVDDAVENQLILSRMLTMAGASVVVIDNGSLAVARAREQTYDLVLMDINLLGMDGYSAANEIRRNGFKGAIIALSASTGPDSIGKCKQAGIDVYLQKPVSKACLLKNITSVFSEIYHV